MIKHNQLLTGKVNLSGHEIDMATITKPVLVFAGNTDGIAPINAVRPLVGLLPNAHEVRFEIVPGGHLGMLTGRAARATTWPTLDEWIEQYSTPAEPARRRGVQKAAKKAVKKSAQKSAQKSARKPTEKSERRPVRKTPERVAEKPAAKAAGKPGGQADRDTTPRAAVEVPDRSAIGSNPERRFASAASRNLQRKP
jgi:polyhydroxyalkanoate synthase